MLISDFYPVQYHSNNIEKHINYSECRESTWNDPAFHSLLSLHSFHSQRVPFISINPILIPLSNHHFTPFTSFHTNGILSSFYIHSTAFQATSIPLHLSLPHLSSIHLHTTATTQFQCNTHNPFCVELGTPNIDNSRKFLDLCVCLFKAHTFFSVTCLVFLTSISPILLASCSARAKSLSCLNSFRRTRLCT